IPSNTAKVTHELVVRTLLDRPGSGQPREVTGRLGGGFSMPLPANLPLPTSAVLAGRAYRDTVCLRSREIDVAPSVGRFSASLHSNRCSSASACLNELRFDKLADSAVGGANSYPVPCGQVFDGRECVAGLQDTTRD